MDIKKGTSSDNFFSNIHNINTDTILAIQKDLEPYDMISLVFLLYHVPDTALQRLSVYERICNDLSGDNMNLLYEWSLHAQIRPTWKYEFLEALTICRQYHIIRKMGFNVSSIKKHYLPENTDVSMYINPIKKVLYRLSENLTHEDFEKLKATLISYELKISDNQTCELLLLELMCQKFINIPEYDAIQKEYKQICNIKKFAEIIDYFSSLRPYSTCLCEIENQINNVINVDKSTDSIRDKSKLNSDESYHTTNKSDISDFFDDLNKLCMNVNVTENLKADTKLLSDAYPIKNSNRVGICCIINQEYFHLTKRNVELGLVKEILDNRKGSSKDLICLETTMSSLNFKVVTASNLDHKETIKFIKDVIKHQVLPNDSVFMLCILSHGVRGHVYAADSVKIKVHDIQNILDSEEAACLHGLPKVIILQACQVEDDTTTQRIPLVADGPNSSFHLKKSHFIIFWATSPEYEAFRHEKGGSLFIQFLCGLLKEKWKTEHLSDIFTAVTRSVTTICTQLRKAQVPNVESTLSKKLYLYHPE